MHMDYAIVFGRYMFADAAGLHHNGAASPHDRHKFRRRMVGDEYALFRKVLQIVQSIDQHRRSCTHALRGNVATVEQQLAARQGRCSQLAKMPGVFDSERPRLQNQEFALPCQRPFHILRALVVFLQRLPVGGEFKDLRIAQAGLVLAFFSKILRKIIRSRAQDRD